MRKRELFVVLTAIVLIIVSINFFYENEMLTNVAAPFLWPKSVSCYFMKSQGIVELGAREWDEAMLIPDRCIFFLAMACFTIGGTTDAILNRKHACAVESAAKTNPASNIFLLYLTPKKFTQESADFVRKLESYNNVYVRRVKLSSLFEDTPLKDWFSRNIRVIVNREDARRSIFELVRVTMLWKYGGIFVDLDLPLKLSLEEFSNFAVEKKNGQSEAILGIGISTALGKRLVDFFLDEIVKSNETRVDTMGLLEKIYPTDNRGLGQFTIYPNIDHFSHGENNTANCPRIYYIHDNVIETMINRLQ